MIIIVPLIFLVGIVARVLRPGKAPSNSRKIAILATAVPPLLVGITSIIFKFLYNAAGTVEVSNVSNTLFLVGLGLIGVYILTLIGFTIVRKGDIAKGIGFGICIDYQGAYPMWLAEQLKVGLRFERQGDSCKAILTRSVN
jgi:hypothetical protein